MSPRAPSARLAKQSDIAEARASATVEASKEKPKTPPHKKRVVSLVSEQNSPRVDDFRKIKGKRGQLEIMTDLPLDIFTEIFGHLEPYDLLSLACASKGLRDIIVGEHKTGENAFRNVKQLRPDLHRPPPFCPPQENILWYVEFLFGRGCQFCFDPKASIIHWTARARLCKKLLVKPGNSEEDLEFEANYVSAGWYIKTKSGDLGPNVYVLKREQNWHAQWNKIKDTIVPVYEWQRQETRKTVMIDNLQARLSHLSSLIEKSQHELPWPWIYPSTSQVARTEPFASVIKVKIEDSSPEILAAIKQSMDVLEDQIPKLVKIWKDGADKTLLSLVLGTEDTALTSVDVEIDKKPLELATTFFNSRCNCNEPILYPAILIHGCFKDYKIRYREDAYVPPEYMVAGASSDSEEEDQDKPKDEEKQEEQNTKTDGAVFPSNPNEVYGIPTVTEDEIWNRMSSWEGALWNEGNFIELDDEAVGYARIIVKACGEDPDTVTSATMNDRNFRVEYTRCVPPPEKKVKGQNHHVMTWKAAIMHDIKYYSEDESTENGWKLVTDEEELRLVYELENKPTPAEKRQKKHVYSNHCVHCDEKPDDSTASSMSNTNTDTGKQTKRHICL
ncbi:hypothetical protein BDN70DRAFT_890751 [Pholiota conissans]|uniref:F-box domain-containing protein n=1 Tax=Pholiota conissans TaxID=109636 RepID=A0A9P5ZBL3_9AGAR|nr:hypothetical protein BDN70DRAFT_890751 [Pholiota conissans]